MTTPQAPMNPVGWFEIYVDDLPRARKFYESVFNITLTELPAGADSDIKMLTFPMSADGKGASGALTQFGKMPPGIGGTLIYFTCADCAVEEARVAPAGGSIKAPRKSIGEYGFIVIAQDTEGNLIGLHSHQ